MNLFKRFFNKKERNGTSIKIVSESGNGFYNFNGQLFQSDVIRSTIRPKTRAIGKAQAKHVRSTGKDIKVNPEVYMRFLLEEPNPYMSGQVFQEKMSTILALNNNAFALIVRDENKIPVQLYPIPALSVEAKYKELSGDLYLDFGLVNGKKMQVDYTDIIHLRRDIYHNDIFGESNIKSLTPLLDLVGHIDQGLVKAIKNSNVIRWLMKFKTVLRPDDIKLSIKDFSETYLDINSENSGVIASDNKYDVEQINSNNSYVANEKQSETIMTRIYNYFNTSENIVQSKYTEDEWNSFYESEVEPDLLQMSNEYTIKLFTRKERGFGNRIVFDSSSLAYASMSTKLSLVQMVDRGAMTPNEWRRVMNLGNIEGGEKVIRRLDTATIEGGETDENDQD